MSDLRDDLQKTLQGTYTIERELGGGGMSRVFLAREIALDRRVVIKTLPPELSRGVNLERFRREIQVAAQLQHPHIVPVLTAGEINGLPYFVMPHVEGASLKARIERGELPIAEVVAILRDVAQALSYAHKHDVVHRDIKPDNILLNDGTATVTDFGIAKAVSEASTITNTGVVIGTPTYMSPEQCGGDSVDQRSDIYSFGILAYEMLTGAPPFSSREMLKLLAAHASETPAPIESRRAGLPTALGALVMQCLAKSPADRPQAADVLLRDLDIGAGPVAGHKRLRLPLAVSAGVVAVLALTAGYRWFRDRDAVVDDQLVAVFPFRVTSQDSALAYLRDGMADLLTMKLEADSGVRAMDIRAVANALRGARADETSREQLARLARRAGAGRLITGEVVESNGQLHISATLSSGGGGPMIRGSAEGAPDSISFVVDRLATQLLSRQAGEREDRLENYSTSSVPALRAYLAGRSLYRRGVYDSAIVAFTTAVKLDPSFIQAEMGLGSARGWSGVPAVRESVKAVLWSKRDRLSEQDRLQLAAQAGVRSPGFTPHALRIQAAERFVQQAPDNVDAWQLLADRHFHFGYQAGDRHAIERARDAFNRALMLDSTYLPAADHLPLLYHLLGDTAARRRSAEHLVAVNPEHSYARSAKWFDATARGDSAGAVIASPLPQNAATIAIFTGVGIPVVDSQFLGFEHGPSVSSGAGRPGYALFRVRWSALMGRPLDAARWEKDAYRDSASADLRPLLALFSDGDSASGVAGVAALKAQFRRLPPTAIQLNRPRMGAAIVEAASLMLWALRYGTESEARTHHAVLRTLSGIPDSISVRASAVVAAAIGDALFESRSANPPDVALKRLDSLALEVPASASLGPIANLVSARLWEQRGRIDLALAAVARRDVGYNALPLFYANMLREEGRLAEAAGDRELAIRSYTHYLALRYNPEGSLVAETRGIAARIERLKKESVGR